MQTLYLEADFRIGVKHDNNKIRLIIYQKNTELVCRKTTLNEVNHFLNGTDGLLFKGRLQLLKDQEQIVVKVKNEIAGIITRQALYNCLASI